MILVDIKKVTEWCSPISIHILQQEMGWIGLGEKNTFMLWTRNSEGVPRLNPSLGLSLLYVTYKDAVRKDT